MSQTSHLTSPQIAALNNVGSAGSNPGQSDQQNAGAGAPYRVKSNDAYVTPLAADAEGSTYQMVRVPTTAFIKSVKGSSQAQGAGEFAISVYYSNSTVDGSPQADATNPPTVVPTTGAAFFAPGSTSFANAVAKTDYTFANAANSGSYNQSLTNTPLWEALGLASDPGGFFDICYVCSGAAVTTGGGYMWLGVDWAE